MRMSIIYNKKAQTVMEYAVLIGLVTVALTVMGSYIRRGIQGAIKIAADEMGTQEDTTEDLITESAMSSSARTTLWVNQDTSGEHERFHSQSPSGEGASLYISLEQ